MYVRCRHFSTCSSGYAIYFAYILTSYIRHELRAPVFVGYSILIPIISMVSAYPNRPSINRISFTYSVFRSRRLTLEGSHHSHMTANQPSMISTRTDKRSMFKAMSLYGDARANRPSFYQTIWVLHNVVIISAPSVFIGFINGDYEG